MKGVARACKVLVNNYNPRFGWLDKTSHWLDGGLWCLLVFWNFCFSRGKLTFTCYVGLPLHGRNGFSWLHLLNFTMSNSVPENCHHALDLRVIHCISKHEHNFPISVRYVIKSKCWLASDQFRNTRFYYHVTRTLSRTMKSEGIT